jgi:hypothetical protein
VSRISSPQPERCCQSDVAHFQTSSIGICFNGNAGRQQRHNKFRNYNNEFSQAFYAAMMIMTTVNRGARFFGEWACLEKLLAMALTQIELARSDPSLFCANFRTAIPFLLQFLDFRFSTLYILLRSQRCTSRFCSPCSKLTFCPCYFLLQVLSKSVHSHLHLNNYGFKMKIG